MKKLMTMLFALMLFCSMSVSVMAASVGVSTDKSAVDAGDTVTVTVKMNETLTGNFRNVQGQLNYDTSAWTYVSHTMGGSYSSYQSSDMPNKSFFTFTNTDFTKEGFKEVPQGTIVTVVFKANSNLSEKHLSAAFTLNMNVQDVNGQSENSSSSASVLICKEHTYDEGKVTTEATCTKEGVKTYTCTYDGCGATKTEKIPATGVHTYDEGKVTTEATCSKEGVKTYTCTYDGCGATKTEKIPATGVHTYDEGKVTTEATCVKEGVKTYTCDCGDTKTERIPATGVHTWDKGKVTTEATCVKEGVKTYTCTYDGCGATKTEVIPVTDVHTWDEGKVTTEATCTKEGEKLYTCTVEGCGKTKTEKIPAAHTWDEGKVTTEATCAKEGVKTYTCTVDGCEETKTEAVEKLAHTVDEKTWKQDDKNHWHECTVCGEKVDSEAHTGGKATTTKKAVCEECGAEYGKLASVTNTNSGNTSNKNNNGNSSNTTTIGTNSPKTGDNSMFGLYGVLLVVSAGALVSYGVYRKRRNA